MAKPQLISFKLCPFVQRSVITLKHKNIEFDVTYIDLADKPAWFLEISPLGKVPVLRVGDDVIFESAVINEYLDEVTPPSIAPSDPLKKAMNRSWIEYASTLLQLHYQYLMAKENNDAGAIRQQLYDKLDYLESRLGEGPFFNGPDFSLVDAAYAPLFQHMLAGHHLGGANLLEGRSHLAAWSETLLSDPAVASSIVIDFDDILAEYLKEAGSHLVAA